MQGAVFPARRCAAAARGQTHYAEIGIGYIEGKKFIHYRALKGTSEYTAAEMAAFLDGIIAECEEQGVQTGPPEKTAQYKEAKKP